DYASVEEALDSLAGFLQGNWTGKKIFISGRSGDLIASLLARRLGAGIVCEPLKVSVGEGHSAATLGLKKSVEENGRPLLCFQSKEDGGRSSFTRPAPMKWAIVAGALAVALFLLPYAEALLFKPWLAKRVSALKAKTPQLATID